MPEQSYKYYAFISYSHKDKKWADWLHWSLEGYKVPKKLVGKETPAGHVAKRLFPIFRDREELPVSADLSANIQEALKQSKFLIVICSPNAAKSKWVNEEILAYKRLGGEGRILCLIVDGEPNAGDKPELQALECFPEALKYRMGADGKLSSERTEPIAADVRKGMDGKANSKLKIAAGLLGVGYDEIKQRDKERKEKTQAIIRMISVAILSLFVVTYIFIQRKFKEITEKNTDTTYYGLNSDGYDRTEMRGLIAMINNNPSNMYCLMNLSRYLDWPNVQYRAFDLPSMVLHFGCNLPLLVDDSDYSIIFYKVALVYDSMPIKCTVVKHDRNGEMAFAIPALGFDPQSPMVFNKDASILATTSNWNRGVLVYDLNRGLQQTSFTMSERPGYYKQCISSDGSKMFVVDETASLFEYNALNGECIRKADDWINYNMLKFGWWYLTEYHDELPSAIAVSNDSKYLLVGSTKGTVRCWNLEDYTSSGLSIHKGGVFSVSFSPDDEYFATGSFDGLVCLYETKTLTPAMATLKLNREIRTVRFSPDGNYIAIIPADASICWLYNIRKKSLLEIYEDDADRSRWNAVTDVQINNTSDRFLVAFIDGSVEIRDIVTGELACHPICNEGKVFYSRFSKDGKKVITITEDNAISLWNSNDGEIISSTSYTDGKFQLDKALRIYSDQKLFYDFNEGIKRFNNILASDPENIIAKTLRTRLLTYRLMFSGMKYKSSMELCEQSWLQLLRKDYPGALSYGIKSSECQNTLLLAYARLAHAYLFNGQYTKAEYIYKKYKDQKRNNENFNRSVMDDLFLLRAKGFDTKKLDYAEAIFKKPEWPVK